MKNIDIRNLASIGVADVDVYNTNNTRLNSLKQINTYISNKNIFVYQLLSPEKMIKGINDIKNILYQSLGISDGEKKTLDIDPISGWITFKNYEYLDRDRYRGIDYTDQQIDDFVQLFFKKLKDVNRNYVKKKTNAPVLFETLPKLSEIIPVYSDRDLPERWLVRYNVYLDYTESEKTVSVPVRDSLIEFTVDGYGVINALSIRWRPIEQKIEWKLYANEEIQKKQNDYLVKLLYENTIGKSDSFNLYDMICMIYIPEEENKDDHHSAEEKSTTVEYYLLGENTIQTHLTPFLIHQNGHHSEKFEILPSCLNISFDITSSTEETKITAILNSLEENTSYSFSWSAWEIANPENFINLGSSNHCSLKAGAFHVLLTVKNNRTGQTEQHQEHVYSTLPAKQQFEAEKWHVWGCTDPTALNYNPNANCDDDTCKY